MAFCLSLAACEKPSKDISFFNRNDLPAQTLINTEIIRSERGHLQVVIDADLIEKYAEPRAKTIYPKGVNVTFFDESHKAKALFRAGYAYSFDDVNEIHTRDSVVIIDYRSHDTVYLHELVWDSRQHRIWSDTTVRSVNGARVTYGDSFESDDEFRMPIITHQRGTLEWNGN